MWQIVAVLIKSDKIQIDQQVSIRLAHKAIMSGNKAHPYCSERMPVNIHGAAIGLPQIIRKENCCRQMARAIMTCWRSLPAS